MDKVLEVIEEFQSTLPQRERRLHTHHAFLLMEISIHAPAKGATVLTM